MEGKQVKDWEEAVGRAIEKTLAAKGLVWAGPREAHLMAKAAVAVLEGIIEARAKADGAPVSS